MAQEDKGHLEVEDRGAVLVVRVDGGKHGLFGLDIATQLDELIDRETQTPISMPLFSLVRAPIAL
jgi:hypothetical protein